ncbi:U1 small nuclear ribonucleoprotein [Trypanosoma theileri]|uniref:U1 small nuclear ribonucleoprotein n=1 Tax=Trypanosoma theileri TaxID=67003 RepID=A0A1X0NYS6_9TRYP|nr:U1 small nuclear ribonucleoprotein [Trypanosoma theileri]ORC89844.1 U1 small nuclear ribonucleoprotein [Trypanosoma theileri]
MQVPREEDVRREEALKRRAEEHARWKAAFFQSRPPPPFLPKSRPPQPKPTTKAPVHHLYKRALELVSTEVLPPTPSTTESKEEPKDKKTIWLQQLKEEMERRNPYEDNKICSDPKRTVVVSNLHPKTIEEDIRLFCERFGRVVSVRLICDYKGKSRRYGFVQFGLEAEARKAVANSRKWRLHGHAVVTDMERGRLELGFLPKRIAEAQRHINAATTSSSGLGNDKRPRYEHNYNNQTCKDEKLSSTNVDSCVFSGNDVPYDVDDLINSIANLK